MTGLSTRPPTEGTDANIAEIGGHGGRVASVLSALALAFSGLSFYESVMKTAALEVYVPPVMHYARDQGGDVELFAIPLTIVNSGARTGTALTMELDVESLAPGQEGKSRRFYSAYIGDHSPKDDAESRSFAPLSLAGRSTFSDTVRFYPQDPTQPMVIEDAGDYRFTLKLTTALPANAGLLDTLFKREIAPITFERKLPWFSDQQLGMRRASIPMHDKNWMPTSTPAKSDTSKTAPAPSPPPAEAK